MKFDFHCHTSCSDGTLSPKQLIDLAFERDIEVLAITDHDTVAAYGQFPPGNYQRDHSDGRSLKLISGCEFSALWNGIVVHVVGLDFDLESSDIQQLLSRATSLREERAIRVGAALEKLGIANAYAGAKKQADKGVVARPHFARYLVESGIVPTEKKAFKKYLGKGKPGDIKVEWPSVEMVAEAVSAAGGVSILAHPVHYDLTRTKLLRLVGDFQSAGGRAIEVLSGKQPANQVQQLVDIANQNDMLSSAGSDFHRPGQPWADLGKIVALPNKATPVWTEIKSLQG